MKCTLCNGKGSYSDSGKYNNCFVCAGTGMQSMCFYEVETAQIETAAVITQVSKPKVSQKGRRLAK
jgi:DnaJ-class molecular chaperone